jgi:mannosyl-oligosaccharide alpha-1,2-mannosidase
LIIIVVFLVVLVFLRTSSFVEYPVPYYKSNPDAKSKPIPNSQAAEKQKPRIEFRKSSFDWKSVKQAYPVESITRVPKTEPKRAGLRVQHDFGENFQLDTKTQARRTAVRDAFLRSWKSYKKHAWLKDELTPVSGGGKNTFGGWAATLVDSLDTLWIMDLKTDFYEAAAEAAKIDWQKTSDSSLNVFETTIRHLGGLLSAYDLSGEKALLDKAQELGDLLYMAFDTPNRMPPFWLNFEQAKAGQQVADTHEPSASPASLSMEFSRLALLTGEDKYYDAVDRIRAFLERTQNKTSLPGMWPTMIDFQHEGVSESSYCIGALADSLYEYLLKTSILLGGREPSYESMYRKAMDTIIDNVLFRPMLPNKENILFPGNTWARGRTLEIEPVGQHLACFAGGMFALGGKYFGIEKHVDIGERIARGCAWAYEAFPKGVMPEIFTMVKCKSLDGCEWDQERWEKEGDSKLPKGFSAARDVRYILRPEAIESLFVMYRVTGRSEFQDMAWTMFESITKATKTTYAYSAIWDVTVKGETSKSDSMEVRLHISSISQTYNH